MQDSTREEGKGLHKEGKPCPREGRYKQERQMESTTHRQKVLGSERRAACKRGKAHANEGKHKTERDRKHAYKTGKTRKEEKPIEQRERERESVFTHKREKCTRKSKENCNRQKEKHV